MAGEVLNLLKNQSLISGPRFGGFHTVGNLKNEQNCSNGGCQDCTLNDTTRDGRIGAIEITISDKDCRAKCQALAWCKFWERQYKECRLYEEDGDLFPFLGAFTGPAFC